MARRRAQRPGGVPGGGGGAQLHPGGAAAGRLALGAEPRDPGAGRADRRPPAGTDDAERRAHRRRRSAPDATAARLDDVHGALDQIAGLRDRPAGRVAAGRSAAGVDAGPGAEARPRSRATIRMSCSTSRPTTARSTWSPAASMRASTSASSSRRTWSRSGCSDGSPAGDRRSLRDTSGHTPAEVAARPDGHRCINFRMGSASIYRWEFDKGRQSLAVAVDGPLIVDDVDSARSGHRGCGPGLSSRTTWRPTWPAAPSYASSRTGAHRSRASSSTTPAGGSSPRRSRR